MQDQDFCSLKNVPIQLILDQKVHNRKNIKTIELWKFSVDN